VRYELSPCPTCGRTPKLERMPGGAEMFRYACPRERCRMHDGAPWMPTRRLAADAWNEGVRG